MPEDDADEFLIDVTFRGRPKDGEASACEVHAWPAADVCDRMIALARDEGTTKLVACHECLERMLAHERGQVQ